MNYQETIYAVCTLDSEKLFPTYDGDPEKTGFMIEPADEQVEGGDVAVEISQQDGHVFLRSHRLVVSPDTPLEKTLQMAIDALEGRGTSIVDCSIIECGMMDAARALVSQLERVDYEGEIKWLPEARHRATNYEDILKQLPGIELCAEHWSSVGSHGCLDYESECPVRNEAYWMIKSAARALVSE